MNDLKQNWGLNAAGTHRAIHQHCSSGPICVLFAVSMMIGPKRLEAPAIL